MYEHIMRNVILLILFSVFLQFSNANLQVQKIRIGAIFFEDEFDLEKTFEATVNTINSESDINLIPIIKRLNDKDGSIALQREACNLIDDGVSAIFGPSSKAESDIVAQICNYTGIPHLLFDSATERESAERDNHQMTLNVFPSPLMLSKAYADIIQKFGWKKFSVLYDEDDKQAPNRLQDILQLRDIHADVVRVRKYKRGGDYRILWKSIMGERRVVLDAQPDLLVELLNASIPFNLTGELNYLFLTNLETHSANLEDLRDNETFAVNITATRLRLNGNFYNANIWQRASLYTFDPSTQSMPRTLMPDMIYDALHVFTYAIQNISQRFPLPPPRVTCDFSKYSNVKPWNVGLYINRVMRSISGVNNTLFRSSNLQFDDFGERVNFNIEIYEPMENYAIAYWDTNGQVVPMQISSSNLNKIVYRVATRIGPPYFMENPEAKEKNLTGNDLYMGYAVDLIDKISKEMNFNYKFFAVPGNSYGRMNPHTKQWDGIIGELMNNDAHMGICDLTITQARKKVVDFTVPFMQLGIKILAYQQPTAKKEWYAFLEPFKGEVWIYVMVAIFLMSLLFMFMARISKEEWENPHPCNKKPDTLENIWDLSSTFWLTASSITTAGSDILPKSPPMRTFNAMWWIFAIIIANSYTANLAAFLTNNMSQGSIKELKDLTEQNTVKYGTIEGGSTHMFFAESNETVYRLANNFMAKDEPSAYTDGNQAGVDRVLRSRGNYMFLMETTSLEYNTERNCDLRALGEKFGDKHYAIAVPFGAEYRGNLSVAILRLSEKGELFELKNKWWKGHNVTCEAGAAENKQDLNFEEVRGIFYMLGGGVFLGFAVGISEFMTYARKKALKEKILLMDVISREIKFVLRVSSNRKPIDTPSESLNSSSRRSSNKKAKGSAESASPKSSKEKGKKSELNGAVESKKL